jgi:hypothetical protein
MDTESRIPVLEPAALTTLPKIVSKPITIPPNMAAVWMYLFNTLYTDSDR